MEYRSWMACRTARDATPTPQASGLDQILDILKEIAIKDNHTQYYELISILV